MRLDVILLLGAAYSSCQVAAKVPAKEDLCGMVVDAKVEQQCLRCFTEAGHISKNPEEVRICTATYLPPDLAECSVPHAGMPDTVRINQGGGEYHNNHTNANYLPSCLARRLRKLVAYQKKEEKFVRQASGGVKYIVESTLVQHGGPTMLSLQAMAFITQLPGIKSLVEESASHCQDEYRGELLWWDKDLSEETDQIEYMLEDLMEEEEQDKKEVIDYDDDDDMADEMEEDNGIVERFTRAPAGNNLPFGGTNSLARRVLLYQCITSALFESGAGSQLLEAVMQDDFFTPIPEWLVEPLLMTAKSDC